ncbi:MAG: TIGR04053 family radical SAM/SPASM domain-containing protein [Chloroflexi bacterium]|nr:TIGR04053 family radical SAM/SPASM domain-containing protein [Chloroflexota bacterium]
MEEGTRNGAVNPPAASSHAERFADVDFDQMPFIVFWEITLACALACVHCRAKAQSKRHPLELTTEEAFRVVDQLVEVGSPLLVISGGDPLMRRDIFDVIEYGVSHGLRVSLSPSVTALLTKDRLKRVKEAGVARISISLDGSYAGIHDSFRGVPGSYARTIVAIADAREMGLSFQVNTTVSRHNLWDLPALSQQVAELGAVVWDVFFLVPTGRAQVEDMISPQQHEAVFQWLCELEHRVPFAIKTTLGMHYRRVVIQQHMSNGGDGRLGEAMGLGFQYSDGLSRAPKGVNDGRGVCFISHVGDVCPSGFLPLPAGNVRQQTVGEIYRNSPLFRDLRDTGKLKGKCGLCEFNQICGGCRARAYAVTGDPLAADPSCLYQPTGKV